MIFVTVGSHNQQFDRLIEAVDNLVANKRIKEKIVMQIGNSTYEPKHAKWFRFINFNSIERYNKNARLVITHGGAGCILTALQFNKPIIAVPRLKKYGEHIDDHQTELVEELDRKNIITTVYDMKNLEKVIRSIHMKKINRKKNEIPFRVVKKYLEEIK